MQHPLQFIPHNLRKPLFYFFLTFTFFIFGVFNVLDHPFRNPTAPNGIVSLELAFTPFRAHEIIQSWGYIGSFITLDDLNASSFLDNGFVDGDTFLPLHYLFFGLGFDYLFMPVYALSLSLGLLLASYEKPAWLRDFAAWIVWGVYVAALFDAVENYALWKILTGNVFTPFPQIASFCAVVKFFLLIMGILVAAVSAITKKEKYSLADD